MRVSENSKILIETYVPLLFLAGIPHVILLLWGPQGSVKSTAQELIGSIADPTITETLTMPGQQRDLVQQLMHHFIPVYDNVDHIPDNIASDLCRACTGGGFEKRQLYSDDDDIIYRYLRKVLLNGLGVPNHRPDFIERCLLIEQSRVPKKERRTKKEVLHEGEELLPYVRTYCLNILVVALNSYDTVECRAPGKLPRMADYAIWAECVARAIGYEPMVFFNRYMEKHRCPNTGSTLFRCDR